jgi:PadR family transcriptional regulator, regulatory protein PadR
MDSCRVKEIFDIRKKFCHPQSPQQPDQSQEPALSKPAQSSELNGNRLSLLSRIDFFSVYLALLHIPGVHVEAIGMSTSNKFDLPQGTLDLLILRVVAWGPIHGYAIAQRIQQISKEALQPQQGSLYPALHRLENKKFLSAEWRPTETGREAKFYKLTAAGRAQLKSETESWTRLTEIVGMILQHP